MKTFVGGKEIKLYGKKELSQVFTNLVQSYLNSGFMIWMSGCSGSQGEKMKIDLSNDNGKTVYRIWMDEEHLYGRDVEEKFHSYGVDTMKIFVKKYNITHNNQTLWMSEGEEVESYTYYRIDERKGIYVFNSDDYIELNGIQNLRKAIYYSMYYSKKERKLSDSSFRAAWNVAKKEKGYKSILLKDITEVTRYAKGYTICFNNKPSLSVNIVG